MLVSCRAGVGPHFSHSRADLAIPKGGRGSSRTSSGVLALERGFPVVVPPLPRTTTGYRLATLRVDLGQ